MAFAAVASAGGGAPTYEISVTKEANPENVPATGGSVTYTIEVTGVGTGFFQAVEVEDGMAGCTLSGPTGDNGGGGAGKLENGETWAYTCTVENVMPGDENTAEVFACHNGGECNSDNQDATDEASVTVGEDENGGGEPTDEVQPTQADTDTAPTSGSTQPGSFTWLLVIAGAILLAGIVATRPAKASRDS
jgi:hypothetical protein